MQINISVKDIKYRGILKTNNKNIQKVSQLANCIRFLAIDAVQKANSGHPGMPMGMADIATVLYEKHLKQLILIKVSRLVSLIFQSQRTIIMK